MTTVTASACGTAAVADLKRCVKEGLVKMRQAPVRRYAYYLTPRGFAEKSRLTLEFMSYSCALFRQAKADCMTALEAARERGYARIALIGASDLAEIAVFVHWTAVLPSRRSDANIATGRFASAPVVRNMDLLAPLPDAVLVTDMQAAAPRCRRQRQNSARNGFSWPHS